MGSINPMHDKIDISKKCKELEVFDNEAIIAEICN